jgi:hypothetical protein
MVLCLVAHFLDKQIEHALTLLQAAMPDIAGHRTVNG